MANNNVSDRRAPVPAAAGTRADPAAGWSALSQVNEWIRFADTKAVAVLATDGVLGGLTINGLSATTGRAIVLPGMSLVAVSLSAVFALSALLPRLQVGGSVSLTYFDHIARHYASRLDEYVDEFGALAADPDALLRETAAQVWANSVVARRKFRAVSVATLLLGVAMFAAAVGAVLQRAWH